MNSSYKPVSLGLVLYMCFCIFFNSGQFMVEFDFCFFLYVRFLTVDITSVVIISAFNFLIADHNPLAGTELYCLLTEAYVYEL